MSGTRRSWRDLPRNVWVVTGTSLLTDVSSEMIVHLIPLFLANVLGARTVTVGLIEGVAETTSSLLKMFSGWFSDRIGQRKWLTVAGYGLSTLSKPFLAIAGSPAAVLGVRFFERMGKGIRTAPRDALVADSIEPERRGLAFGVHRAGDTLGATLGLLAAFVVVWLGQGHDGLLHAETFRRLVWLSVIPALLAVALLVFGIREPQRKSRAGAPAFGWSGLPAAFRRYVVIVTLFTLGNSSDAFLVLRAQERGLNVLQMMGLLTIFNLIYTVISGPAGALSDRIGRRRLLVFGWGVYALIYLGFAAARAPWHVWVLFACYGAYYGLAEGSLKAMVADLVRPEERGTAYGAFHLAIGITALPASVIAGLLWQGVGGWSGFGAAAPFYFGAILAVAAILLLTTWMPRHAIRLTREEA
ncbi:MAG: MFS transporter [Candidatus Eisenbacteria bacterium]|uniref:MFS transporter n=1 Tax=Eiseniibacteriota bacterium TaxID=2212470 RepID=A0A956RPP8_UNCEI|nr:MFS transporter [Candidatus Eisenbacteria bacterium]